MAMESPHSRKLKNYLIRYDLQLKIIVSSLFYMTAAVILVGALTMYPLVRDMFGAQDLNVQYQAAQAVLVLVKRLIPAVVAIMLITFLSQILITHRVCGPLVNFSHAFNQIAEGNLTRRVAIRKTDYLTRECEQINRMIDGMTTRLRDVKTEHNRLMATLEAITNPAMPPDSPESHAETLKRAREDARRLGMALDRLTLNSETDSSNTGPDAPRN